MATGQEIVRGEAKAIGDARITGEVIHVTTGEAKVQSVCQHLMVGSLHVLCCWPSSQLESGLVSISCH